MISYGIDLSLSMEGKPPSEAPGPMVVPPQRIHNNYPLWEAMTALMYGAAAVGVTAGVAVVILGRRTGSISGPGRDE